MPWIWLNCHIKKTTSILQQMSWPPGPYNHPSSLCEYLRVLCSYLFIAFYCLADIVKSLNSRLNRSGSLSCSWFWWKSLRSSPCSLSLAIVLSYLAFIMSGYIPSISNLPREFVMKGFWIWGKAFSTSSDKKDYMTSVLKSTDAMDLIYLLICIC